MKKLPPTEAVRMVHDLVNLLTGVDGYINIAAAEENSSKAAAYYAKAASCSRDAVSILSNLRKSIDGLESGQAKRLRIVR